MRAVLPEGATHERNREQPGPPGGRLYIAHRGPGHPFQSFTYMNTTLKMKLASCLFPAMVGLSALVPGTLFAEGAQKEYTLFEGANISVNLADKIYPLRDVNGSSWVVVIDGQEKVISAAVTPVNLKIVPSLKLTEESATISGLKREPAYTFNNDPTVRMTRGLVSAASVSASYQAVANQANAVDPSVINTPSAGGNNTTVTANIQGQNASGDAGQVAASGANASVDLQGKQEAAGYDAMSVEFEVTSEKPIPEPYIVTMTKFHPRGTPPGTIQSMVFAKALEPIGAKASKVKFSEEGFPFDYEVVDFQIHLYNAGVEIATNTAEKREVMTPDQAFSYVKRSYIEAHKSGTLAAVPVMGDLPPDLGTQIAAGKYADTVYVKVSKEGLADRAFADSRCSKRIEDPYLDSVVKGIRFKPALAEGVPVEGVAELNLSRLRI